MEISIYVKIRNEWAAVRRGFRRFINVLRGFSRIPKTPDFHAQAGADEPGILALHALGDTP
jgi:hypothetical protein